MPFASLSIDRVGLISFLDYFFDYLLPGRPCLFEKVLTANWRSISDWVNKDGKPSCEFLAANFGAAVVPVTTCKDSQAYNRTVEQTEMKLSEYLQYISQPESPEDSGHCLYLKDWHFQSDWPSYSAYDLPSYFQSDWLNEFCDIKNDPVEKDYRFVYIGKKGTWTPFHADVFRSHSWSANVCGRKLWLLVRPGDECHFVNDFGDLVGDIRPFLKQDLSKGELPKSDERIVVVVQEAEETIFVPSGWHHQVHNLEDTISINHNWVNASNISCMIAHLNARLSDVEREIDDLREACEDWRQQCQILLKADVGIDYETFTRMLVELSKRRAAFIAACDFKADALINCKSCCRPFEDCEESRLCLASLKETLNERCQCIDIYKLCSSCEAFLYFNDLRVIKRTLKRFIQTSPGITN